MLKDVNDYTVNKQNYEVIVMKDFIFGTNSNILIPELEKRLKRLGIDCLEVCAPGTSESDAADVRRLMLKNDIMPWSVHACYLDRECHPTMEDFEHDAKIASILGAKIMVTHAPSRLKDGSFDYDRFREGALIAEKYGLSMALETCHFGTLPYSTTSYKDLIEIVDHLNMKNVGINVDTGHTFVGDSRDVASVIREVGPRLLTLHLHDNFGEMDDHQAVGIGFIKWEEVMQALHESPYEGPLMVELSGGHAERRLVSELNYEMSHIQEIVYSRAWLRYLWDDMLSKENENG